MAKLYNYTLTVPVGFELVGVRTDGPDVTIVYRRDARSQSNKRNKIGFIRYADKE